METRSDDFINDALKKANTSSPQQFADSFSGEPNPIAQKIAVEIKLVDALFAAALAPYNRVLSNARPFAKAPMNELPQVLLKFLLWLCSGASSATKLLRLTFARVRRVSGSLRTQIVALEAPILLCCQPSASGNYGGTSS